MLQIPKVREKLLRLSYKSKKILFKFPRITSSVFIIGVFMIASGSTNKANLEQSVKTAQSYRETVSPTISIKKILTPTPQFEIRKTEMSGEVTNKKIITKVIYTPTPLNTPLVQGAQTAINTPPSNSFPTNGGGLLSAVNSFRNSNGLSSLSSSGTLCGVADKRLNELISLGNLDGHAGFNKFFQGQSEFNSMGEIIFQSSSPKSPEYAVNEGWAKSTSGHKESMLDAKWNYGCGATNGYFSVFNFGKK